MEMAHSGIKAFSPAMSIWGGQLLQMQVDTLAALKLDIRSANDRGNFDSARDLLQRAENQAGSETRDPELETLADALHLRETAPDAGDYGMHLTNDGQPLGEVTRDAGGSAGHEQSPGSFASEIQLGSYGHNTIGNSGQLSQKAFPGAGGETGSAPSAQSDPLQHNRVYQGVTKGPGASQAAESLDDGFGAVATTLDIGGVAPVALPLD